MNPAKALARARQSASLTQLELASRAGTSQATISAYENGAKTPSLAVLERLLGAAGTRLVLEDLPGAAALDPERQAATARTLHDVLVLAEALPVKHDAVLGYPRLPGST